MDSQNDSEGSSDAVRNEEWLAEQLAEASVLADHGRWHEALDLLLEAEAQHPDDTTLICMLGVAAAESGASGLAHDFFRRCIDLGPQDPLILTTAGQGLAVRDDPEAERVLRLAAVTSPHLAIARQNYGRYLAREGMFDLAIAELEAAQNLAHDDTTIPLELAIAHLLAGRPASALPLLADSVAADSEDSWVQALYGLALADAGHIDEAAAELRIASLERPEDWEVHLAAALAAAAELWEDEAWAALSRAELTDDVDSHLVREVEECLEAGGDASLLFLREEVAGPLLRVRLASRN